MTVTVERLQEYCEFGEERVYLLLGIARSKENEATNSSSEPVIRKIVEDEDELTRKIEELDHATSRFDARFRLYISANARDTTAAFFELRDRMDDWLRMRLNGDTDVTRKFKRVDSEFKSVLQSDSCKDETNFIFDLDDVSQAAVSTVWDRLEQETTIHLETETPNGCHIVTAPFNYSELDVDVEYERKTDGLFSCPTSAGPDRKTRWRTSETPADAPEY